jgi:hypothetical protein
LSSGSSISYESQIKIELDLTKFITGLTLNGTGRSSTLLLTGGDWLCLTIFSAVANPPEATSSISVYNDCISEDSTPVYFC